MTQTDLILTVLFASLVVLLLVIFVTGLRRSARVLKTNEEIESN